MSTSAGRVLMIPKGDYDATVTYTMLDVVSYQGKSYVAKQTTTGNAPTNTTYWQLMVDSQGHTIKDSTTTFPNRANLLFSGFIIEDDPTNNATVIMKDYTAPSWATGTDAEIERALQLHYNGVIDLNDYWSVGDERTIHLSAMEAIGVGESHEATDVTFVLMNSGGKTLADGTTECAFVVGMKEALVPPGYINSTNPNSGGWRDCARRTWCNNVFYNALPSSIKSIFKQFINQSGKGDATTSGTYETTDYFALPAEVEVFGSTNRSVPGEGTQFKYYETAANRIKLKTDTQEVGYWAERSPVSGNAGSFCYVTTSGAPSAANSSSTYPISPFGCI